MSAAFYILLFIAVVLIALSNSGNMSTLEVIRGNFYNEMRYINLRFTYLLTYSLTYMGQKMSISFWAE